MDYEVAKHSMVVSQLRTNAITDEKVLEAFYKVDRQDFVPENYKDTAYLDEDIPVVDARVVMEPLLAAHYIQSAAIKEDDQVLVIAAGLGYETALAYEFTNSVIAVEDNVTLRKQAEENLNNKSIDSIAFINSVQNNEGAVEHAPFDAILILGGVEELPETFLSQLREGGCLIYIERTGSTGRLKKLTKKAQGVTEHIIRDAYVPILPGFEKEKVFTF